jgi:hypothetical protein
MTIFTCCYGDEIKEGEVDETSTEGDKRKSCKRTFGSYGRIWEGTIKINLKEIAYEGEDWIKLAQYMMQGRDFCEHVNKTFAFLKFIIFLTS